MTEYVTGFCFFIICCFAIPAVAQSALSQNSGINSADPWVTLDLTTQTQNATMTLPSAIYNPVTKTTSNVVSVISATVTSGTAISIKSTINGSATNYSLSTSSTFNPSCTTAYGGATYCFTSPAFTAAASGSEVNGGTD